MKVFFGTEAAEGMGHVAPWAAFARGMLERGWGVHMAAPNLGQIQRVLGVDTRVCIWQAPVYSAFVHNSLPSPKSWPELLVSLGYGEPTQMAGAVKAWVNILKGVGTTAVLADYAPGLILAAHVLGVPCLEVGGGFCVPPLTPRPQKFPGIKGGDNDTLNDAVRKLTLSFDSALRACGDPRGIANLCEMESWPVHRVVTSTMQLDHYGPRPGIIYSGFLGMHWNPVEPDSFAQVEEVLTAGETLEGALNSRINVLGYLKPETPGLQIMLDQLGVADVNAFLVIPDAPTNLLKHSERVRVINHPIDLLQGLKRADVYLSNGGLNGVGLAMESGCWPIVVPMQAEQVAMARRLVGCQSGAVWWPQQSQREVTDVRPLLRRRSPGGQRSTSAVSAENFIFNVLDRATKPKKRP